MSSAAQFSRRRKLLARDLGSPFAPLGIWMLTVILALAGGVSSSELGAAFPEAGGECSQITKTTR
jgi:basic amino acid/polyamine antiporter, APA family